MKKRGKTNKVNSYPLIETWQKFQPNEPPYLFPEDKVERWVSEQYQVNSYEDYVSDKNFNASPDTRLHLGLLPIPYLGNLARATIFLLMLNPGQGHTDYYGEYKNQEYRAANLRNLFQENKDDEYPFFCLDPRFSWHGGFEYWKGKLYSIISTYANHTGHTLQEARRVISKNVACLELIPYHSRSFGAGRLLNQLSSVKSMKEYVHEIIVPKAKADEAVIIVTRAVRIWDLPKQENILQYTATEARAAYLTKGSRGGKAILRQLGMTIAG